MMRKLWMMWMTASLVALLVSAPAAAGALYKWVEADGSVSFTDDLERVPKAARGSVTTVETRGLRTYGRYTPRATDRTGYVERLHARIERLRAINEPELAAAPANPVGGQKILQLDDRVSLIVPDDARHDEPITIEKHRVRDSRGGLTTNQITVVRQGDRVLSVERARSANRSGTWTTEEEVLGIE